MTHTNHNESGDKQTTGIMVRIPQSLSIKDIITIVGACMSLVMAWGVFSTRLAVIENELVTTKTIVSKHTENISDLSRMVEQLKDRQSQSEIFIDQLYDLLKKNPPRRRIGEDGP